MMGTFTLLRRLLGDDTASVADEFRSAWSGSPDVIPVLLLLGGDVVQASIAQLAGSHLFFAPTVFSFGWVAYSLSGLLSAVGDNRLMPRSPESPCVVINGESGYSRDNRSWVIARILRDFYYWKDEGVEKAEQKLKDEMRKSFINEGKDPNDPGVKDPRVPLSVSIYNVSKEKKAGNGIFDAIYVSSFFVILVQLAVAATPCGLYHDWSILMVTGAGTLLAWCTAALPQWREEKIEACRKESHKSVVITAGNGTTDAIVINGCGNGLDLEDLATGSGRSHMLTRIALSSFVFLWIGLLITVAGLKQHTWFLLGVGIIGTAHNIFVAGLPRRPAAFGIYLEYVTSICESKVMLTLQAVEKKQPSLGISLVRTFFPGDLRDDEKKWMEDSKKLAPVKKEVLALTEALALKEEVLALKEKEVIALKEKKVPASKVALAVKAAELAKKEKKDLKEKLDLKEKEARALEDALAWKKAEEAKPESVAGQV